MNYFDRIREILAPFWQGDDTGDITMDTSLTADLNMDSFMLMEAATMLENAFDISIPDQDLKRFITIGDVVEYLETKGS